MRAIAGVMLALWWVPVLQAQEEDRWLVLRYHTEGTEAVDTTTLRVQGDSVQAWVRRVFNKPQTGQSKKPYTKSVSLVGFNCASREFQIRYSADYAANGEIVEVSAQVGQWLPAPPGSIAEAHLEGTCAYVKTGKPHDKFAREIYDLELTRRRAAELGPSRALLTQGDLRFVDSLLNSLKHPAGQSPPDTTPSSSPAP